MDQKDSNHTGFHMLNPNKYTPLLFGHIDKLLNIEQEDDKHGKLVYTMLKGKEIVITAVVSIH
eukprot:12562828-Ditylum_brightwellii.AAC.1